MAGADEDDDAGVSFEDFSTYCISNGIFISPGWQEIGNAWGKS